MKKFLASAAVLAFTYSAPAMAITTSFSNNANALAASLAGTGFNIINATLTTSTENGFFASGSAGTGIDSGVVLTTGTLGCTTSANTVSDCSGGGTSASLSINFTLDGPSLFFNYVFASEEYNEFVNQGVNDTFQLLLDGVNIARLPNNDIVSIDTVNLGANSAFYRNNEGGALPLQYDGLTTVLTASASGITAGVHNLTFVINDVGDSIYDSAVFIQAGTIGTVETPVPEPAMLGLFGLGAIGLGLARRRKA